ncbi:MAG: hypothetical protein Q9174_000290 [Haloplaca sp. 1 TL-2023]
MSADHLDDVDPEDIENEEASSLLRQSSHRDKHSIPLDTIPKLQRPFTQRRQSSLALRTPDGLPRTPRTANRVRFEVEEQGSSEHAPNGRIAEDTAWLDDEDYLSRDASITGRGRTSQHAPLLTGIEAPSVTVASTDLDFNAEDLLESARPKSSLGSAFMNMANSIIGAGIIGQPYALRQAGLTMGIVLLVALTITVDWTIRLIVVNSKLSGANSFQTTMEYCYGKSGLIAISVAQWAL